MIRPHLLYIAFFYPPTRASGVYRALASSVAFADAGWDVTVITTTERFFEEEIGSADYSLMEEIPSAVQVVRVPFTLAAHTPELRDVGWLFGNFPLLWAYGRRAWQPIRAGLDLMRGRSANSFPMDDRYLTWIEPVVSAGQKVHRSAPIDHVLATGNPYSSFEAARVIAALVGVPFSIDYRDPWTTTLATEKPANLSSATYAAEAQIVEEAAAVFHVNQAMADASARQHPRSVGKQHVARNGYDLDSLGPPREPSSDGPLRFGMLGTITEFWPMGALVEGWIAARDQLPPESTMLLAGHLGYFGWSEEGLRALLPDESFGIKFVGPVPKAEVGEFYGSLDVVVVPAFGGPMVTTGKIFEAAGLGIPVVCVQPAGGGARVVVDDHPYAFGAEPDSGDVSEALVAAAACARSLSLDDVVRTREEMSSLERHASIQPLVAVVEDLTGMGVQGD